VQFSKMKVVTRLGLGFGLVAVLLAVVTMISITRMAGMQAQVDDIVNANSVESQLLARMDLAITNRALAFRNLVLLADDPEIAPADQQKEMGIELKRLATETDKYNAAQTKLGAMFATIPNTTEYERGLFEQIKNQAALATTFTDRAQAKIEAKDSRAAYRLLRFEFRPVQKKWWEMMRELAAFEEKLNGEDAAAITASYQSTRTLVLTLGGLALACSIIAAVIITRSVVNQLGGEPQYAADIAAQIAAGDLTVAIATRPGDDSSLIFAMQTMRDSLARMVDQVQHSAEAIESASVQIAAGNLDLSSRTEQQAGSLEETSSSMEELTSTVRQNADHARQANALASAASDIAVKGGAVVAQVVGTMGAINESSRKIVDIIGVIDGIAFQTNILALNAAVEAARAGEQGRGFAVVATEVRNLAQRSAAAAKEIKTLIDNSVGQVDLGSTLVNQAGSTMEEVVDSIHRVTDIMTEITAATQEQSAGIEQVNEAIVHMDQATQQNAALVEEATAATASMQDQAAALVQLVGVFKLHDQRPAAPAKAAVLPLARKAAAPRPARPRVGSRPAVQEEQWEAF